MTQIHSLSNYLLVENLKSLVGIERQTIAEIVQYIHEVDRRKLYFELGYSSLHAFCRQALKYSEGATFRRIQAARCLKENPEILGKLSEGSLSLCAVGEISRVGASDRAELIAASAGKSRFEVQKLVATKIPERKAGIVREKVTVSRVNSPLFESKEPVEKRYTVTLELSEEEFNLLEEEVQAISSERVRSRAVVRALKMYRKVRSPKERQKRRVLRAARKQKITSAAKVTRNIPVKIRDEVHVRDGGQCTYHPKGTERCTATFDLQVDHIMPFSLGGEHEPENLRLLCGAHNRHVYREIVNSEDSRQE